MKVLQSRYFPCDSFLNARTGSSPSWLWSSLLYGRDLLKNNLLWQVGNGHDIYIWNTNWIPSLPDSKLVSSHHTDVSPSVASLINWTTHSWDLSSISTLLTLPQQVAVQAIPLVSAQTSDKLLWPLVKSGIYTVRSGYHIAHQRISSNLIHHAHSSHLIHPLIWKLIWGLKTLPRISFGELFLML